MILDIIRKNKIIAIVRGLPQEDVLPTAQALYDGGIRNIEVTFNTKGAPKMIQQLKEQFGDKMCVGAGTVLDGETARTAILAGADFLLAPSLDEGMIRTCNRYGKLAVPGVMTPTEIVKAYELGAQMVKIFPAAVLGPAYFKQVKGPLNFVEMMAVGGIDAQNFTEYLKAGASTVGVGGQLVDLKLVAEKRFDELTALAKTFTEQI